ncbi:hypothetical protein [Thermogemmatispora onikobensis]|uniref:hypothetical protein n=1 Tax=Thermogemmatispora onikobensis TaxID=732234 RepID=UPI00085332DC|nr:hypothetical protein [Thermogemmatispora onikobensis]
MSFALPLASRRLLDAALFVSEAGLAAAAACLQEQALLCGQAQLYLVQQKRQLLQDCLQRLTALEAELPALLAD